MLDLALVLLAALLGGALNALAGGGSFVTLPTLMLTGVPPVMANATGTLALLPGYVASCVGYRRELGELQQTRPLLPMVLVSLAGGVTGALLLLLTPDDLFRALVPWLLLLATLLFLLAPHLTAGGHRPHSLLLLPGVFLVSVYGGYFNGGMGILLMALFVLVGAVGVQHGNAAKNLLSAVLTLVAVGVYVLGGQIVWSFAVPMMVAALAGGYLGAVWGRRLPATVLRAIVASVGAAMSVVFFVF